MKYLIPYYFDSGIGMGFRRLSIIDLDLGHQPMSNEDGTIWICFNGEIYNFQILRNRLSALGHHFKTNSDTEVMIHAYEQWGIEAVEHLNGMFSIALWDSVQSKLLLFRDRMGVKPVYWTVMNNCLIFASEVKSIRAPVGHTVMHCPQNSQSNGSSLAVPIPTLMPRL